MIRRPFPTVFLLSLSVYLALETPVTAQSINVSEYFPLESGMELTYRENGLNTFKITVLPGTELVNGVQTKVMMQTGGESSGTRVYYTNDANGIREHKDYSPSVFIEGVGYSDMTIVLSPPAKYANQYAVPGEMLNSSGSAIVTYSALGTFDLHYDLTTRTVGLESVSTPLGTFTAAKVEAVLTISGFIYGTPVSETTTETIWMAKHIGMVKSRTVYGADTDVEELTGLNFSPPLFADFSASTATGLTPLSIQFTDLTTGYPGTWQWSFGDGATSQSRNPSHTYSAPGRFAVSLTVTGLGSNDTRTKQGYIRVGHSGADISRNGSIGVADAILALQIAAGKPLSGGTGVNSDSRVGPDEAIYILQWASGSR